MPIDALSCLYAPFTHLAQSTNQGETAEFARKKGLGPGPSGKSKDNRSPVLDDETIYPVTDDDVPEPKAAGRKTMPRKPKAKFARVVRPATAAEQTPRPGPRPRWEYRIR